MRRSGYFTTLSVTAALVALSVSQVAAQSRRTPTPEFSASCPASLTVTYQKIAQRSFGDPEDDLTGFVPSFLPNTVIRLISAHIAAVANPGESTSADMADNQDTAKPGQALIYTFWRKGEKAPDYAAAVTCHYEGGLALQKAVPATMRSCSVSETVKQPKVGDSTNRTIVTKADVKCRA
ncbi:MAG: hypothetical protein HEQ16_01520 [Bosea sp.]|jgi:hypothetical protein|nr:hypothetical protein [Bosea sp. (in: a-proteobacteria)]